MSSLYKILDNLSGKRIVLIGDVILDEYIWGTVRRISPEAPVPVVEVTEETYRCGGAANVANNLRSLEASVFLCGVVGDDKHGQTLTAMLSEAGVNVQGLFVDKSRPTTLKTRVIARNQQVVRIDRESRATVSALIRNHLLEHALHTIQEADAIIFADYDKGVVGSEVIEQVVAVARKKQKMVAVDPKAENFWNYSDVTVITPNQKEAGDALHTSITDEATLVKVGQQLLSRLRLEMLLITRSEHGMTLFERTFPLNLHEEASIKITHIPTVPREVFDVTGAGDTVISVFTLALVAGATPFDAARLANYAAGIVVGEVGCTAVTPEELRKMVKSREEVARNEAISGKDGKR